MPLAALTPTAPATRPRALRRSHRWLCTGVLSAALAACGGGSAAPDWVSVDAGGNTVVDTANLQLVLTDYAVQPLSTDEADGLAWMRQEEQLAHEVYAASALQHALPVFSNIASSELTHTAAVKVLLDRYAQPDPLAGLPPGQYASSVLQALHDQLVATSATGLIAALQVGVQIEELDITDIQQRLAQVDNADIRLVYESLMKGSRNHLRGFMAQLVQQGGSYTPQYLPQADFNAIVQSAMETGR